MPEGELAASWPLSPLSNLLCIEEQTESMMDKVFHHHDHHKEHEEQPQKQNTEQVQAGQDQAKGESKMQEFKEYIKKDEEGEREGTGKEYGGLM